MKNSKYIIAILYCVVTVFSSCELAENLDDFQPLYSLPAEAAITDQVSADLALAGMYATLRQTSGGPFPIIQLWGVH